MQHHIYMEWNNERPTESGQYHFKGKLRHKDGFTCYLTEPIEVEVVAPEQAVYSAFMVVGDSPIPSMPVKQFIRSVDGKYVGEAERWDGEWAGPIEPRKV